MAVKKLANGQEIDKSVNAINYTEFVVKQKVTVKSIILKIVVCIAFVALFTVMMLNPAVAFIGGSFTGAVFGLTIIFIFPMTDTKFFYETESGLFTIKTAHGIITKKKAFEVRFSNMQKIAPLTSEYTAEFDDFKGYVVEDYTSHKFTADDYFAVWEDEKGKKHCAKFQCTTSLLKIMKHYNKAATVMSDTLSR